MSDTDGLEGIDVTNDAYDLDHYEAGNPESHPTRGLQQYEWTWQLAEDPTTLTSASFTDPDAGQKWINEQLASIAYDSTTNVLISYRVRDIDGIVHEEDVGSRRVGKDAHDKARTEILSGLCVCLRKSRTLESWPRKASTPELTSPLTCFGMR